MKRGNRQVYKGMNKELKRRTNKKVRNNKDFKINGCKYKKLYDKWGLD